MWRVERQARFWKPWHWETSIPGRLPQSGNCWSKRKCMFKIDDQLKKWIVKKYG